MLPKTGQKFPGGNDRDGRRATYTGIVADALARELGSTHRAAKILMGWTGAGERTVKHWLAGAHGPGGGHLLVLMRESEEVAAPSWLLAVGVTGLQRRAFPGRRTGWPIPHACGLSTRVPAGWRRSGPPPRARMTVIMTVFVTVMMTVIRPVRRVPKARATSVGRGFLMRWGRAGAWRQPRSWNGGGSQRRRLAAT